MPFAQGSCDALREDGQKLECAHSSDFRRQPRTVQGREGGGAGEEGGRGQTEKIKTAVKEELSLESESYAAMAGFVLNSFFFLYTDLIPYFHRTLSYKTPQCLKIW